MSRIIFYHGEGKHEQFVSKVEGKIISFVTKCKGKNVTTEAAAERLPMYDGRCTMYDLDYSAPKARKNGRRR